MRIGFIGPFCTSYNSDYGSERQVGAIEQQFFGIAKGLMDIGHEVVITRNWSGKGTESAVEGVRLLNVNTFSNSGQGFSNSRFPHNRVSYLLYLLNAPKRLVKCDLDIVCTTGILQSWISLKAIKRTPAKRVFIANNNDVFIEKGVGHTRTPFITEKMFRIVNREYHATVAITNGLKEYLKGVEMRCDDVIPNAVEPAEYSCGKSGSFILTASRLVPHKRIEQLIQVYCERMRDTVQDLVVIGSGPCEKALKQSAASKCKGDRIKFLPFLPQSEYRRYLSDCSLFVLPSEAETFGVVILEAMACSKPVIARNTIGPKDIITNNHDGVLFSNLDELEEQMTRLLSDDSLRQTMGRKARETVEASYTFKQVAAQYGELFESLVKN